jgi:hypothetical protein
VLIHQSPIVGPAHIVRMGNAIIHLFNIPLENTDLYTTKENIDNHGSWIDQASITSYDCEERPQTSILYTTR